MRRALTGVALLLAIAGAAWLVAGPEEQPTRTPPRGFSAVSARVSDAAGQQRDLCVLLAATEEARQRGMMRRRDLAGFDAMVFEFPEDTNVSFYMRAVPVALDLGWLDGGGRFLGMTEMAPCADREGCPTYPPPAPFRTAVETLAGDLAGLGLGRAATLERTGGVC